MTQSCVTIPLEVKKLKEITEMGILGVSHHLNSVRILKGHFLSPYRDISQNKLLKKKKKNIFLLTEKKFIKIIFIKSKRVNLLS